MDIHIDLATLDLSLPSGVPLTDMALVLGDKIPLRISLMDDGTEVLPAGTRPALAVKTGLSSGTLVLAATNLEPVSDALGDAYVGSLSVNTHQLLAAMATAERIDLVGEMVLIAPDGAQRSSRLIRVTVRRDLLREDIVPPEDVITNWQQMIGAALSDQLPNALHDAGMYVTPVPSAISLKMPITGANTRNFNFYTFPLNSKYITGHMSNRYMINKLTLNVHAMSNDGTTWRARLWRYIDYAPTELGESIGNASFTPMQGSSAFSCAWEFSGVEVSIDDRLVLDVYAVDGNGAVINKSIVALGLAASAGDLVGVLHGFNPATTWRDYSRIAMTLDVSYADGVTVGGVELATREHFDALAESVTDVGPQVHSDAAQVAAAANTFTETTVPQAVSSITATTGLALDAVSQAQTEATAAITPLVSAAQTAAGNATQSSTAAANSAKAAQDALDAIPTVDAAGNMTLPGNLTANGATINGQLNANGGVNIPVPPVADTDGINRLYASGLVSVMDTMRVPLYLSKSKSTLTQGAFAEPVLGLVLSAPVAAKSRQRLSIGLDYTMHAASNYSQGLGWVLPLHSTVYGQLKVSVSYGHGVYTVASSDDMDAYEIYPTDATKSAFGAAIDIYLDRTNIGGNRAAVRTRVIYHDQVTGWMVRTITAHVDINNTGLISATSAIVYQQHSDRSGSGIKPDYGSIWLIRNGLVTKNIIKIADVPGIHCYNGAKLNSPILFNGKAEDIYANMINVGAPMMQLACGNGRNPAYYGFQALETNAVISMTTAPYDPPTNV